MGSTIKVLRDFWLYFMEQTKLKLKQDFINLTIKCIQHKITNLQTK